MLRGVLRSIATPSSRTCIRLMDEGMFVSQWNTSSSDSGQASRGRVAQTSLLSVAHAVSALSKCSHWHMICVRWYCQCPSMFPDTRVRGCDWLMGCDRAENWSSARSEARSLKAVKWHCWVRVCALFKYESGRSAALPQRHITGAVSQI